MMNANSSSFLDAGGLAVVAGGSSRSGLYFLFKLDEDLLGSLTVVLSL